MKIFHGSKDIIKKPEYGKGKPYNDYGLGFYCTEDLELAKEWSCSENQNGWANAYEIDLSKLNVLYLNSDEYNVLHWLAILVKNRDFRITNPLAKDAKEYILKNFLLDTSKYDIIIGYRADDSYFAFAEDFLNNAISVQKLAKAMKLGNLGEQVVLVSEKAFKKLEFIDAQEVEKNKYYALKAKRDTDARNAYLNSNRKGAYNKNEIYVLDLMRQEVKADGPRI